MIQSINTKDGVRTAIIMPASWDRSTIQELKDGLLDIFSTCFINEETKDCTDARSLYFVLQFAMELIKEFEDKKGRG